MSDAPFFSICIPCYAMGGHGATYLRAALSSIAAQSFQDLEVVVTDQSDDDAVQAVCASFPNLTIRHIWTRDLPRQGSANTNAALSEARGEVAKILFQDDFLNGPEALSQLADQFTQDQVKWVLSGCDHTRDGKTLIRPFTPHWHDLIRFGRNTVSSPSVLAVRRVEAPRFDENLIWLMDVDFYHQCAARLGPPTLITAPLVVNRLHDGQVSAGISRTLIRDELRYVRAKYPDQQDWAARRHYWGRLLKTRL